VKGLIDLIYGVLAEADELDLAGELRRLVPADDVTAAAWDIQASAAALTGWLRGLVQGEILQSRIQAEADAYARERVKAERPVGFE
jgi:hypothetical protein